jgi:hypothetical protein
MGAEAGDAGGAGATMTMDLFANLNDVMLAELNRGTAPPAMVGSAVLSDCEHYRYSLTRRWSVAPMLLWLMLNPSWADAMDPDPTVTRVVGFSRDSGYGGCTIGNLYAWRHHDPKTLRNCGALGAIGPDNDEHLRRMLAECAAVVCAWGGSLPPGGKARAADVLAMVREAGHEPLALRVTKSGQPTHPLYLPAVLRPVPLASLLRTV